MKTICVSADEITRGNIIENDGEMCHVLRNREAGKMEREFLLMPFGSANQGMPRYTYPWSTQRIKRYVASEVS